MTVAGYSLMSAGLHQARNIAGALDILGCPGMRALEPKTMTVSESALTRNLGVEQLTMYQRLFVTAGTLYCQLFHNSISRPVAGKYRCWKCLREFELKW